MKSILFVVFIGLLASSFKIVQNAEFVCLPCGRECDSQIYRGQGKCASCGMNLVEKSTIHFSNISVEELCQKAAAKRKALVLDVRSAGEFAGSTVEVPTFGHFKNAININVTELEGRVKELDKYKDSEILVYCSHAHRSAVASYFLSTHGFKNVKNMMGGVSTIVNKKGSCLDQNFEFHKH